MSNRFIKSLASDVVRNPTFVRAMEAAVSECLTQTMKDQSAGSVLRLYVPKVGSVQRSQRAALLRAQYTGSNIKELAEKHGLSVRHVRRIVKNANVSKEK